MQLCEFLFSYVRVIFVAARDGQLPLMFSGVHRYYKTPIQSVLFYVRLYITVRSWFGFTWWLPFHQAHQMLKQEALQLMFKYSPL